MINKGKMKFREKFEEIKDALKKVNPFKCGQSDEIDVTTDQQRIEHEQTRTHPGEDQIEPAQNEEHAEDELEIGEERRRQNGDDEETLEFYDEE